MKTSIRKRNNGDGECDRRQSKERQSFSFNKTKSIVKSHTLLIVYT